MFGIGKNQEAEKTMERSEKERGEDEIEFDFEEDEKLPFDDDDDFAEEGLDEEEMEHRGLSSRSVILLGLVLLLALGGGVYYYLNSASTPPVQPAAPVTQKIKVQPASPVTPSPIAVVTPAPAADVVVSPVASRDVVAPSTPQPYSLAIGAFLDPKHQRSVEKKIRSLGYTPKVQTAFSMVPMTRLLLGVYDPAAAAVRRTELKAQIPDLFTLKKGDKLALYAGSFQSLNSARSYADQLYLRGIHVDEETVSLRIPLKKVSYGAFSTRAAAEKAAQKASAAGLTAQVVKH